MLACAAVQQRTPPALIGLLQPFLDYKKHWTDAKLLVKAELNHIWSGLTWHLSIF